jgi:hypothetical protein
MARPAQRARQEHGCPIAQLFLSRAATVNLPPAWGACLSLRRRYGRIDAYVSPYRPPRAQSGRCRVRRVSSPLAIAPQPPGVDGGCAGCVVSLDNAASATAGAGDWRLPFCGQIFEHHLTPHTTHF